MTMIIALGQKGIMMNDLISRQAALGTFDCSIGGVPVESVKYVSEYADKMMSRINALPSAQPEIIRCNACRHWHQTTGKMKGFGLGDCDYLEKKLVTCNGYCYWAERRTDERAD